MRKAYLSACMFIFSALTAQAFGYPTAGGDESLYTNLFTKIEKGECAELESEFVSLSASGETINNVFYSTLCMIESGKVNEAYKGLETLIHDEDYDEALYLLNLREQKAPTDSKVYKYRGDIYESMAQTADALESYKIYQKRSGDPAADYLIVDFHIKHGDIEKATEELKMVRVRDERFHTRSAALGLIAGNTQTSLKSLRIAEKSQDPIKLAEASRVIADVCLAYERYDCAEKTYANLPTDEAEILTKSMEQRKKRFGALIMLGEQYDTNVSSVDEDVSDFFSEEDSFRTYIAADLKLNFYGGIYDKTELGLLNYKAWNHSMPDYNAQLHKAYVGFTKKYDNFELLLPYLSYTYVLMDDKTYSDTFTVKAQGTYLKDSWRFYIPLEFALKNYRGEKEDYNRDGEAYKAGLGVSKSFGLRHIAKLEGHIGREEAEGKFRQITKSELNASYTNILTERLTMLIKADGIYYDYDEKGRHDFYASAGASLFYKLAERHFLSGGYSYYNNNSNDDTNDYDKHIIDISISYLY